MITPASKRRKTASAADHVLTKLSLVLGASALVTLSPACGPQDALVGAQNPDAEHGQSGAGTGGTGRADTTVGGAGKAGGSPLAGMGGDTNDGPVDAGGCERCGELPHVRPDALVECLAGECVFAQAVCEDGFAHCDGDFSEVGCESDLTDPAHCGRCSNTCDERQVCLIPSGFVCSTCSFPTVTTCRNECADLQNDHARCGSCDTACDDTEMCREGACDACGSYRGSCGGQNSCADWLRSDANCGSCGRQCSTVSMTGSCTPEGECQPLACPAGRADCDADLADCEAELEQPGACGPQYVTSSKALAQEYQWWALASDGSWLATKAGALHKFSAEGELLWTYSPPRGAVRKVALDTAGFAFVVGDWGFNFHDDTADTGTFFAKLDADGVPVWERELEPVAGSRVFPGPLAVDGSGGVVVAVEPLGDVDVDPTAAVNLQHFDGNEQLLEIDANGAFSWLPVFEAKAEGVVCDVSIDALARSAGRTLVVGETYDGCELAGRVAPVGPHNTGNVAFIASLGPSGSADRLRWLIGARTWSGNTNNDESSLVAYADGSAAMVASFKSLSNREPVLYFDDYNQPLAIAQINSRFVARFSAELELQWFKVAAWASSPVAAPDGGLLALFQHESTYSKRVHPLPTLWRKDGSSAWTMPVTCHWPEAAGAAGEIFATRWLGGFSGLDCDLDPGPNIATVAESAMVTTYRF